MTSATEGSTTKDWHYWEGESRRVLGLPRGKSLREIELPRPWYLVPESRELSEEEASGLFSAVRRRLLGDVAPPRAIKAIRSVRNLSPDESLPLLYAMRHVARERGSLGRYWPAFHNEILEGQLALTEVQVRLARELGQLWIRLYEHTRGALYYPREGRRFIKWPLAHAGLLRRDEEALTAFGSVLASEYGGDRSSAPLVADDLDEFLQCLVDWFQEATTFSDSRLAHLVSRKDGTEVTIGELAQRWLRDQWENVITGQVSELGGRARSMRCYLRYDAAHHRILLVLCETAWPDEVQVSFHWGDVSMRVRTRFIRVENTTESDHMEIPVLQPQWQSRATLAVGEKRYPVRVPKTPDNRALIFRAKDGRATRQWRLGEEYYVLLPSDQLREDTADVLFEEWVPLGQPLGDWKQFDLLWVRTSDPLRLDSRDGRHDGSGFAEVVGRLEQATQTLRLPSFGHLWRPRVYLVGGRPVPTVDEGEAFERGSLPWLEVRGVWEPKITLALVRREERRAEDVHRATLVIPPPVPGQGQIVDLWDEPAMHIEGDYTVEIDRSPQASFQVVRPATPVGLGRFELHLEVEGEDGEGRDKGLTRGDLERGALVARAWPLAELLLQFECGTWTRTVQVRADERSRWRMRWRDLGLGRLPGGPVAVTLSWRGLAEAGLSFADVPFVADGDIEVRWVERAQKQFLELSAAVSNRGDVRRARVVALGARPWRGEMWTQAVDVGEDGFLRACLEADKGKARWLAIFCADAAMVENHGCVWVIHTLSDGPCAEGYSSESLVGDGWKAWEGVMDGLRETGLPPGLHDVVGVSCVGAFLTAHSDVGALGARWVSPERLDVVQRMADWAPLGLRPSVAVFESPPRALSASRVALLPPYLTPISAEKLIAAMQASEGTVRVACTTRDGRSGHVVALLRVGRDAAGCIFEIAANQWMSACCKCGLILPAAEFRGHHPPTADLPLCTAQGANLISVRPGTKVRVCPLILWDPGQLLASLATLLLAVSEGDQQLVPPSGAPWLDELERIYFSEGQDLPAGEWLRALADTAMRIWEVITHRTMGEKDLPALGWQVHRYQSALDIVYRWLDSEMR